MLTVYDTLYAGVHAACHDEHTHLFDTIVNEHVIECQSSNQATYKYDPGPEYRLRLLGRSCPPFRSRGHLEPEDALYNTSVSDLETARSAV